MRLLGCMLVLLHSQHHVAPGAGCTELVMLAPRAAIKLRVDIIATVPIVGSVGSTRTDPVSVLVIVVRVIVSIGLVILLKGAPFDNLRWLLLLLLLKVLLPELEELGLGDRPLLPQEITLFISKLMLLFLVHVAGLVRSLSLI